MIGKVVSLGFLGIGIFVLMQIIMPLLSFQLWMVRQESNTELISPQQEKVLGVSIENKDNFPRFISNLKRESSPNYSEFQISIPKIKIEKEVVFVDSNDLSSGLVQLPGSALPGEKGNLFVSGHSALSPLFNFETAPFAKLIDLKKGDQIEVWAGGVGFKYEIVNIKAVDPKDLSVIAPPDDLGRYLTLMTCVPPGLNTKRLIVLAKMI